MSSADCQALEKLEGVPLQLVLVHRLQPGDLRFIPQPPANAVRPAQKVPPVGRVAVSPATVVGANRRAQGVGGTNDHAVHVVVVGVVVGVGGGGRGEVHVGTLLGSKDNIATFAGGGKGEGKEKLEVVFQIFLLLEVPTSTAADHRGDLDGGLAPGNRGSLTAVAAVPGAMVPAGLRRVGTPPACVVGTAGSKGHADLHRVGADARVIVTLTLAGAAQGVVDEGSATVVMVSHGTLSCSTNNIATFAGGGKEKVRTT
jgi:hypothetical protein